MNRNRNRSTVTFKGEPTRVFEKDEPRKFEPMGAGHEGWWYHHSNFHDYFDADKRKTLQMHRLGKSKKHL